MISLINCHDCGPSRGKMVDGCCMEVEHLPYQDWHKIKLPALFHLDSRKRDNSRWNLATI